MPKPIRTKRINPSEKKNNPVMPKLREQGDKYQAHKVLDLFETTSDLLSIKEASEWATNHLGKSVTPSNISYLIQYGRVKKFGSSGNTMVSRIELIHYYKSFNGRRGGN